MGLVVVSVRECSKGSVVYCLFTLLGFRIGMLNDYIASDYTH